MLRQSSKESDLSGVGGVGSKEETQTCQPSKVVVSGVGGVGNVGFSGDNSRPSADYRNGKSEVSGIGAQEIHHNNTNTINLDFFWSNNHPQSARTICNY